jgi:hypothetical protein
MEEKIKTPQTQNYSFYLFSASQRLGVENCFSIHSIQFCSRKNQMQASRIVVVFSFVTLASDFYRFRQFNRLKAFHTALTCIESKRKLGRALLKIITSYFSVFPVGARLLLCLYPHHFPDVKFFERRAIC